MTAEVRQWAKSEKISHKELYKAASEVATGRVEAGLGGGLYKKRIALENSGKSGGARTLLAYNKSCRVVFLFGFKKSELSNIPRNALLPLKRLAKLYNNFSDEDLAYAVKEHELYKVVRRKE